MATLSDDNGEELMMPSGGEISPARVATQAANLIQVDGEALIGGQGLVERVVDVEDEPRSQPMASLVEEDEGVLCKDCALEPQKLKLPDDFSGDLNEFAELAYAPNDDERDEYAHDHPLNLPPPMFAPKGVPQYGMRPGDELIGGFGRADETGDDQENLEVEEGIQDVDDEVHEIVHSHEVLGGDVAAKEAELNTLKKEMEALRDQISADEEAKATILADTDRNLAIVKATYETKTKQAEENYREQAKDVKQQGLNKLERVRLEESRIHERKLDEDANQVETAKTEWEKRLRELATELNQEKARVTKSEARADELENKEDTFAAGANTKVDQGLRTKLSKLANELEDSRSRVNDEEKEVADLTSKVRDEQHGKSVIEERLKSLHKREEVVAEEEREIEAANSNLRHELDEDEFESAESAEEVARARNSLSSSIESSKEQAESEAAKEEKSFEHKTLEAAQDEIARLKEELARQERKEAHEEQELLQQTMRVREQGTTAEDVEAQARVELEQAYQQVSKDITHAEDQARAIVDKAKAQADSIRLSAQREVVDDGAEERVRLQKEQKVTEKRIKTEESAAKKAVSEYKDHEMQQLAQMETQARDQVDKERAELLSKMQAESDQRMATYDSEAATKLNDVNADTMMAKIRLSKDEQELAEVAKQNEQLHKAVSKAEQELEQQHAEWAFQQVAQQQSVTFPTFDDEQ